MSNAIWDKFLTERDRAVIEASGYGLRQGFGKRPALLVVDVSYSFCDERPVPILESVKRWRTSCGEDAWIAIPYIQALVKAARERGLPIAYTTGEYRGDNWDKGAWGWKSRRINEDKAGQSGSAMDGYEIVSEIAPQAQDIVVYKQKPSAFAGTGLASYLTLLGCDSIVVTGTSTSGCVRATVLDAFNLNYRVSVVQEACFDRLQVSHAVSLLDMNAKYADVVGTEEVVDYFKSLSSGMFDLPSGV